MSINLVPIVPDNSNVPSLSVSDSRAVQLIGAFLRGLVIFLCYGPLVAFTVEYEFSRAFELL